LRRFRPLLALVLVVAAVASWQLVEQTAPPQPPVAHSGQREVDHYVTGFDVVRMTQAGQPAHRLRAASLRHYTDDDTTELGRPQLTIFQDDAPPWEIDAERAWVSADGSLVLLSGDVRIERAGGSMTRPMRMHTRDLRVQPRQDYAETDEKVRVDSDVDWLEAVGMQAWLRPPSRIKFLSQVKGHHVPR
jgi:lipopolysaccharide export system protein LptC